MRLLSMKLVLALASQLPGVTEVMSQKPVTVVLAVAPGAVVGGNATTASITLSGPAPSGGLTIKLSSYLPQVVAFEGASVAGPSTSNASQVLQVTIPEGASSAKVGVRTFGVAASTGVLLRAEGEVGTATTTLTVNPATVSAVVLAQPSVVGGNSTTGTVQLNGAAAPVTGTSVQLAANIFGVSMPPVVTVPPGASTILFTVQTTPVLMDATGIVGAIFGSTVSTPFTVRAPAVSALTFLPTSVLGGNPATGSVVLNGTAPSGRAINVSLSSNSADAIVPRSVSIVGSDRVSFQISTRNVTGTQTAAITARISPPTTGNITDGTSNTIIVSDQGSSPPVTANLTITPNTVTFTSPRVQSVTAQPASLPSGSPVSITTTLQIESLAQVNVSLTTDRPDLLQLPASVPIPAGTKSATISATTTAVLTDQTVKVTAKATLTGSDSVSTTVLLQAVKPIAAFTARPNPVVGGVNIIAQLTPTSGFTKPFEVKLRTDHPELVEIPASVMVAPTLPAFLTLRTLQVKERSAVTITATAGTQTMSVTVIVSPQS